MAQECHKKTFLNIFLFIFILSLALIGPRPMSAIKKIETFLLALMGHHTPLIAKQNDRSGVADRAKCALRK